MIHKILSKFNHHSLTGGNLLFNTSSVIDSSSTSSSTLESSLQQQQHHKQYRDLPCEVILYCLEFYEFPLHRYLYLLDGNSNDEDSSGSSSNNSPRMNRSDFIQLLYGYFSRSPNSDTRREKRQIYLIFSYIEFRANNIRNVCDSSGRFLTIETPVLKQVTPFRHVKGFDISHVETLYCFNINENLLYNFANTPAISLVYCNFEYNKLFHDGGISLLVSKCPHIERINVSKTSVTFNGLLSIVKSLNNLRELCANHISSTPIKSGTEISMEELEKAQEILFEYLANPYKATNLVKLELKRCTCTNEQIDSLLKADKLEKLDISFCNWLTSGAFQRVRSCKKLKWLDLSFVELDMDSVKSLSDNRSIEHLYLDSCSLEKEEMAYLLSNTSNICHTLKHITLSKNREIEGNYRSTLGNLVRIQSMDLSMNSLQGDFFKHLHCAHLRYLDLHRCSLRDEDAKLLFLRKSITNLDLSSNRFVDATLFSFFSLMNNTIRTLNLSKSFQINNREKRWQSITDLMKHTTLVDFEFCGNLLTDEEATILLKSRNLKRLNINNNFLNGDCLKALRYDDKDNLPALTWLDMSNQHYDIKQDILVETLMRSQEAHDIGYGLQHFSFSDQYLDNQVRSIIVNRCTKITELFIARDEGIMNIHLN
jgi:hypothetical protein